MRRVQRVTRNQNRTRNPRSCELIKETQSCQLNPETILPGGDLHPASPDFLHLTRIKVASLGNTASPLSPFLGSWQWASKWKLLYGLYMQIGACSCCCCNLLRLLFLFIFFPLVLCSDWGLEIYAQARAADSYFFAFNKASLQNFSTAFLGIFCWKFNLLQNVRRFLHIFQQNSWFTIFVSFSCSAVPTKPHPFELICDDPAMQWDDGIVSRNALYRRSNI